MKSEDKDIKNRFLDLANRSYQKGTYTFTDFLTPTEQALFFEVEQEISFAGYKLFGGAETCERQIVRFGKPEQLGYEEDFPIACIQIKPLLKKFADDLTHRDFLGALMNLGIKREVLGDIVVNDKSCYLFCETGIAHYICDELTRVKHTSVACNILKETEATKLLAPTLKAEEHIVSGPRADAVIAKVYKLSRGTSIELFRAKKIFVNGRLFENNSGTLKPGDVVSVRGYGKFIFDGVIRETKKGKLTIKIEKYV